jgi:hypothetical protein
MTYIIRHSERLDYYDQNLWIKTDRYKSNPKDPPITKRGIKIASDATIKILEDIQNISEYKYIYCSPFSRCIDTAIVIATTIEILTSHKIIIRIEYSLRELYPLPLQSVMDEELKNDAIFIKYSKHLDIFDLLYKSLIGFNTMKDTTLNPLTEIYRPLDTIEKINLTDKKSIICTHGLNLASMYIKFPANRVIQISDTNEKKGRSLGSYCYTAKLN